LNYCGIAPAPSVRIEATEVRGFQKRRVGIQWHRHTQTGLLLSERTARVNVVLRRVHYSSEALQ